MASSGKDRAGAGKKAGKGPLGFLGFTEKELIAFLSALASGFLTFGKLIIGILTGSLGILSEALHSFLDLLATLVTFFAVRASEKPADREHPYGHGKIENISALTETLLLMLTVVWIIYEATRRIILGIHEVEVNFWSFAIVITAIIIDAERSMALFKAAKAHDSQALKADAIHFSTDILSSSVVLAGLVFTWLGFPIADSIAAIGVALIVLWISIRLGKENLDELMDRAPEGVDVRIMTSVKAIRGIKSVPRIRVRKSGSTTFVDLNVIMDHELPLVAVNHVVEQIISKVKEIVGNDSDVVVHVESEETYKGLVDIVKEKVMEKESVIKSVHDMSILQFDQNLYIITHVEVLPSLEIGKVEEVLEGLREEIKQLHKGIKDVIFHVEPFVGQKYEQYDPEIVKKELERLVAESRFLLGIQSYDVFEIAHGVYSLILKVYSDPTYKVRRVHKAATELEDLIKELFPFFVQVIIEISAKKE